MNSKKINVVAAYKDDSCLYLRLTPRGKYDNTIFMVDQKTGNVTTMPYTEWIVTLKDSCEEIDINDAVKKYKDKIASARR